VIPSDFGRWRLYRGCWAPCFMAVPVPLSPAQRRLEEIRHRTLYLQGRILTLDAERAGIERDLFAGPVLSPLSKELEALMEKWPKATRETILAAQKAKPEKPEETPA